MSAAAAARSTHLGLLAVAPLLLLSCLPLGRAQRRSVRVKPSAAVAALNRITFDGNVLSRDGGADDWVVLFCVSWHPACRQFRDHYAGMANRYNRKLDSGSLLSLAVRFAEIDCAVDKVLCNAHAVETYPTVVHYHRGERAAAWTTQGGSTEREIARLAVWAELELVDKVGDPSQAPSAPPPLRAARLDSPRFPVGMAVAMAAGLVWLASSGTELWRGLQLLLSSPGQLLAALEKIPVTILGDHSESQKSASGAQ